MRVGPLDSLSYGPYWPPENVRITVKINLKLLRTKAHLSVSSSYLHVYSRMILSQLNFPKTYSDYFLYTEDAGWAVTTRIAVKFGTAHGKSRPEVGSTKCIEVYGSGGVSRPSRISRKSD